MNKLEALGLVETTSKTQKKNGTRCWYDPIADCDYLSYASGYVRRAYTYCSYRSGELDRTIYQLNLTRKGVFKWKETEYDCTERIMIPSETDRLSRLVHCVAVYRNNKK
jgi:hypothetical protein